jgi:hypothetical protein
VLDLNDYEMPIYSMDKEAESGIPQLATDFITNWNRRLTCNLLQNITELTLTVLKYF